MYLSPRGSQITLDVKSSLLNFQLLFMEIRISLTLIGLLVTRWDTFVLKTLYLTDNKGFEMFVLFGLIHF